MEIKHQDDVVEAAALEFAEAKRKYEDAKKKFYAVLGRLTQEPPAPKESGKSNASSTSQVKEYLKEHASQKAIPLKKLIQEIKIEPTTLRSLLSLLKKDGFAEAPERGHWKWVGGK